MNISEGNWNQIKGKLKQEYGELMGDDVTYVEGREDELIGQLQEKLGKTKEEIAGKIKSLLEKES
ncbi:MAG: CsbD family protein [Candidatus Cyclonatronum sp.]|uniref:CsbD family protein n=1 Tax=Cyclonatronum sp. TaxID=3024185 RepID=UPI0025B9958A|nr:CsbD family protein [Cyclonatronum sp.]MCH8486819.1 CsbD family protein [Cyclonatronum sp.]